MSRTIVIIQARMTSTRLPGKSLMLLAGKPMIEHVVERARAISAVDEVWVATTNDGSEAPLVTWCNGANVPVHRGSADDVLSRFASVARESNADAIVRITADCPLLDPQVSGAVLQLFLSGAGSLDYASNTLQRTFPRGLDTEVFSRRILEGANAEAADALDREHVTRFFYRRPERFHLGNFAETADYSHLRWTVDTPDDFAFMSAVCEEIRVRRASFAWQDILRILAERPELQLLNAHVEQKHS
jgi:spore coat polysaccharide biosynthesis protein SpsF